MLTRLKFAAGLALAVTIIAIIFAVSVKTKEEFQPVNSTAPTTTSEENVLKTSAMENPATHSPETNPVPDQSSDRNHFSLPQRRIFTTEELALLDSLNFGEVRDVKLIGNRVLLATAGGVVEFYSDDSSFSVYSLPQGLPDYDCNTIVAKGEDIYVGTNRGVYNIDPIGIVTRVWSNIDDTVTSLKLIDNTFLIGTRNNGLYRVTGDTIDQLLANAAVTAVTKNQFGLWVATTKDGLLSNKDGIWQKRFLKRDSTVFNHVTSLESGAGKLWVGTDRGLMVFNGGTWETIDSTKNLFDQNITALSVGMKFIYIGTANGGAYSYYDQGLSPLDWTEGMKVSSIDVDNGNYLVGLEKGGAILKTSKGEYNILPVIRQTAGVLSGI